MASEAGIHLLSFVFVAHFPCVLSLSRSVGMMDSFRCIVASRQTNFGPCSACVNVVCTLHLIIVSHKWLTPH